jgi:hypothetical protein
MRVTQAPSRASGAVSWADPESESVWKRITAGRQPECDSGPQDGTKRAGPQLLGGAKGRLLQRDRKARHWVLRLRPGPRWSGEKSLTVLCRNGTAPAVPHGLVQAGHETLTRTSCSKVDSDFLSVGRKFSGRPLSHVRRAGHPFLLLLVFQPSVFLSLLVLPLLVLCPSFGHLPVRAILNPLADCGYPAGGSLAAAVRRPAVRPQAGACSSESNLLGRCTVAQATAQSLGPCSGPRVVGAGPP